jgi:hypothetical protein
MPVRRTAQDSGRAVGDRIREPSTTGHVARLFVA